LALGRSCRPGWLALGRSCRPGWLALGRSCRPGWLALGRSCRRPLPGRASFARAISSLPLPQNPAEKHPRTDAVPFQLFG
ncbi:MAG: hypothetical protein N2036_12660, partial [Bryobacteraceae bacterium]|nr:hypothetical protein [Bryobacteraceae bacterium]